MSESGKYKFSTFNKNQKVKARLHSRNKNRERYDLSAFFGDDMKQDAYKALGAPILNSGFAVLTVNHRSSRDAIFPARSGESERKNCLPN